MVTMNSFQSPALGLVVLVERFKVTTFQSEFSAPNELVRVYANPSYLA